MEGVALLVPFILPIVYAYYAGGMYKLNVCACSSICNTGLFVFMAIFFATYHINFWGLLTKIDNPCNGGIGECNTISCIAGNLYFEGYVFMFFWLCIGAIMMFRYVATKMQPTGLDSPVPLTTQLHGTVSKIIVLAGCVAPILTAIFPDFETTNVFLPTYFRGLHSKGLFIAFVCGVFYPYLCFWCKRQRKKGIGVFVRSVTIVVAVFFVIFDVSTPTKVDPSNYCAQMNQTMCENWPCGVEMSRPLPPFTSYRPCEGHDEGGVDLLCQPRYNCTWVSNPYVDPQLLFSSEKWISSHRGRCVKDSCPLYQNAKTIQSEFCLGWVLYMYMISYTLFDVTATPWSEKNLELESNSSPSEASA